MEEDSQAYYRLVELFVTVVPTALSQLLEKAMADKPPADGYQHTSDWWKKHKESLSRAPPAGFEIVVVDTKAPADWPMNLLLKVIKYSNYDLLKRSGVVWEAVNKLIEVRGSVLEHQDTKKVPLDRMQTYFTSVFNSGISKFNLPGIEDMYEKIEELKTKSITEEEGEKFQKQLLKQEKSWTEFEERLYERGGQPRIVQLRQFHGKNTQMNVIQQIAPHFTSIGAFLLKDDTGAIVDGIRLNHQSDVVRTTEAIISKWLREGAAPTWNVLVKCLRHAGLNPTAKAIDDCLI